MAKYIVKRFLLSLVTILLVVSIVFLLLRLMPTDYFFTEDELIQFTETQKNSKLARLGMMKTCPVCGGSGKVTDENGESVKCTNCLDGTGYVKRSSLAQLVDFYGSLIEYRAETPIMVNKANVEQFSAEVYISKEYLAGKPEDKDNWTKIKAKDVLTGTKKEVYISKATGEGVSTKDAYLENDLLFVKKECSILGEDDAVPEGYTAFEASTMLGEETVTRSVLVKVNDDETAGSAKITLSVQIAQRDYRVLGEGESAAEGESVYEVTVGKSIKRVALKLDDTETFVSVDVNKKAEEHTVPFFKYLFARLAGDDPFEGIGDEDTYVYAAFNLGKSIRLEKGQYVIDVIGQKIGPSLEIGLIALAISLVLGVVLGVLQAKNRVIDTIGTGYTVLVNAVPRLVIYTIIMMMGASILGLPMRYDANAAKPWLTKVLPVVCLSVASTAGYMLWTRRYMVDELNKDYIRLAKLKGLSDGQVMFRHVLKNAFVPLAQYLPYSILLTVGGSLLVEKFFSIPGMGPELTFAISRNDLNLVQGIVMLYATMGIFGVFLGDLLMTIIDPRIKLTGKEGVR